MRLLGQLQVCLFIYFFLRKGFERTKTQIKPKPTDKTKPREKKDNKGDNFSCTKTSKGGKLYILRFSKKLKLS